MRAHWFTVFGEYERPVWDKIVRKGVEWREMARRYVVRSGKYRGMHYIFWDRQEWGEYLGNRFRRLCSLVVRLCVVVVGSYVLLCGGVVYVCEMFSRCVVWCVLVMLMVLCGVCCGLMVMCSIVTGKQIGRAHV